jgi:hypothetical protein
MHVLSRLRWLSTSPIAFSDTPSPSNCTAKECCRQCAPWKGIIRTLRRARVWKNSVTAVGFDTPAG